MIVSRLKSHSDISSDKVFITTSIFLKLKETRNSFKKWPLNLWWISNKTIIEVGNITKATTFESFLYLSYKNTQLLVSKTVLFNIFMRQTLTNNFCELHKIMNCAFPLRKDRFWKTLLLSPKLFKYLEWESLSPELH